MFHHRNLDNPQPFRRAVLTNVNQTSSHFVAQLEPLLILVLNRDIMMLPNCYRKRLCILIQLVLIV